MNDQNRKHTFVICAYKESPFLEQCIQSLLPQQDYSNIIVYSSTPNAFIDQLCQQYNLPFVTAEGGTIGKDWNHALAVAKTPLVTIAHQDDVYNEQYAQKMIAAFERYPDTVIAFSDYEEWENGEVIAKRLRLKVKRWILKGMQWFPTSTWWKQRCLSFGNPIGCPAVTFHKKNIAQFQFSTDFSVNLDWYAWYQLSQKKGRFSFIDQELMAHRIHEDSETSHSIQDKRRAAEDEEMLSLFWPKWVVKRLSKIQHDKDKR